MCTVMLSIGSTTATSDVLKEITKDSTFSTCTSSNAKNRAVLLVVPALSKRLLIERVNSKRYNLVITSQRMRNVGVITCAFCSFDGDFNSSLQHYIVVYPQTKGSD